MFSLLDAALLRSLPFEQPDRLMVLWVVIRNGMTLVAVGIGLGVLGARLGGRILESQLYGVSVTDTATLGGVRLVVLLVALVASWLPARRAAEVEPHAVLKEQ